MKSFLDNARAIVSQHINKILRPFSTQKFTRYSRHRRVTRIIDSVNISRVGSIERKLRQNKKDYTVDNTREVDYISVRVTNSIQPGSKAAFNELIACA